MQWNSYIEHAVNSHLDQEFLSGFIQTISNDLQPSGSPAEILPKPGLFQRCSTVEHCSGSKVR